MSTDIDWQLELDSSFGAGDDVAVGHYVTAGHRAVRRRRAASVAIAAAMTVGVGAAWASGTAASPDGSRVASTHTATPTPTPTSAVRPPATPPRPDLAASSADVRRERADDRPLFEGQPTVAALGDGELVVKDGWSVDTLIVVEARRTPARTWGIVTSEDNGPGVQWIYLRWTWGGDVYTISEAPGETAPTFGAWLPEQPARTALP